MVSTCPVISKSSFINPLVTVQRAPNTISIIVTLQLFFLRCSNYNQWVSSLSCHKYFLFLISRLIASTSTISRPIRYFFHFFYEFKFFIHLPLHLLEKYFSKIIKVFLPSLMASFSHFSVLSFLLTNHLSFFLSFLLWFLLSLIPPFFLFFSFFLSFFLSFFWLSLFLE